MDYSGIKTQIIEFCGQQTGGTFEALVGMRVNGVYRRILSSGYIPHEQRVFSLTSVASKAEYGLPLYVKRVMNIEDPDTPRFIHSMSSYTFDKNRAGTTETGTPISSFSLGTRGVQVYPSADGIVSVESDAAGDTGSDYKVRLTGFNTSGVLISEQITVTGSTAVNSSNSYDSTLGVQRVVKEAATGLTFAGNITIKDAAENTLAVIPPWWDSPDYEWIRFDPIPGAAITYNIRCEMRKAPLLNAGDWPEIDQDYHDLLVFGVTKDLLPTLGKAETGMLHGRNYEDMRKEFEGMKNTDSIAIHTFADVQNHAHLSQRPHQPLIQGVHFGLA